MKKVSVLISLVFLSFIIFSAYSFAQMEMGKGCQHEMKMMVEKEVARGKCGQHQGCMMHQAGGCKMGSHMGMKMCGMMGEGEKMGCCKREFFLCCKEKLELTDKQVKVLKSIKMDFQKNKIRMEADLQIAMLDLKALMSDEEASLKKIESNMRNVEKLKTDMKLSHLKAFKEAKELLTEEQKEKMMKCHKK